MEKTDLVSFTSVEQVQEQLAAKGCAMGLVNPKDYHAWKKTLGATTVSKSTLSDFLSNPFRARWKAVVGADEDSDALRLGAMVDCNVLTPELWSQQYVVEDVDRRTKAGKARAAELDELGITAVSSEKFADIVDIAGAAMEGLKRLVPGSEFETQVGMWVSLPAINKVKLPEPLVVTGMLDVLPLDESLPLIDLKTTSKDVTSEYEVNKNMAEYAYGLQAAIYTDLWQACTGQLRDFAFLYVGTSRPAQARIVNVTPATIEFYRSRYQQGLLAYSEAASSDRWGERILQGMTYEPPAWEYRKGVGV